jgi:hypothetical protein
VDAVVCVASSDGAAAALLVALCPLYPHAAMRSCAASRSDTAVVLCVPPLAWCERAMSEYPDPSGLLRLGGELSLGDAAELRLGL